MNRKIVLIGGLPGTGKTTVVRAFRERLKFLPGALRLDFKHGLVAGESYPALDLAIIGTGYDEPNQTFAGTDKLSMGVQPKMISYALSSETEHKFLIEGDRLFTKTFIEAMLFAGVEITIFRLQVPDEELKRRYEQRGSNQSEQFIRGRKTKIANIVSHPQYSDLVRNFSHVNLAETNSIVDELWKELQIQ